LLADPIIKNFLGIEYERWPLLLLKEGK